ncbi:MAG: hypothetical protein JO112_08515, partial [Planctomycetes bacterium]|nr:hypothetical protein [Planctomycetota bacterium]
MTETQWATSTNLRGLLDFLAGKTRRSERPSYDRLFARWGDRKVGVFAAACCRR